MVLGIDFGNDTCYVAVARTGGIETIDNDYSLRSTPSYVSFARRQRIIGVGAKSQLLTNLQKTVFTFKRFLGKKFTDPIVQDCLPELPFTVSEGKDGGLLIHINYLEKPNVFSPEQITAMLFTKLKDIANEHLKGNVKDVVVSCPTYFTDAERRALLNAASIANLNVLQLMNDTTASALAYGIYKQDLPTPEERSRNVIIVDIGHVGIQAAACSFTKGNLLVKSLAYDRGFGGKYFDCTLVEHFANKFQAKTGLNPKKNHKAMLKLTNEVEKVKKQMSANTNLLPLRIECLMQDKDLDEKIDRSMFEELMQIGLMRIEDVLIECFESSTWDIDEIDAIELVGGSTRIPAIRKVVEKVFGKSPSTTLNSDEAVSRGCALQCAILSPTFKVRPFCVTDVQPYPITISYEVDRTSEDMIVFPKFHCTPVTKMLSFDRKNDFCIVANYELQHNKNNHSGTNSYLGTFHIENIRPGIDGGIQHIKVNITIDNNGILSIPSAFIVEEIEIEEEVPIQESEAMEIDDDDNQPSKVIDDSNSRENATEKYVITETAKKIIAKFKNTLKMAKQKKISTRNTFLPIRSIVVGSWSKPELESMKAVESRLIQVDIDENERLSSKNELEEYMYSIPKIEDDMMLKDAENWLYEDGEDCEKDMYIKKLEELKIHVATKYSSNLYPSLDEFRGQN